MPLNPGPAPKPLGLVLCGGASSRMGRAKWGIREDGCRWVDRAVEALAPLCGRVILSVSEVSGWPGGFETLHDLWPSRGPLAAWATFAAVFPGRDLLSLSVDMPGLETRDLAPLQGDLSAHLVSELGSHYLAAYVRASDLVKLSVPSRQELGSVEGFWQCTAHHQIPVAAASRAIDRNTPETAPAGL